MTLTKDIELKIKKEIEANTERAKRHQEGLKERGESADSISATQDEAIKAESRRVISNLSERNTQLKKALIRIKNNTYLDCENCGDEINKARLKALLTAELCSYCAEKDFQINKVIRPEHMRGQSQTF